MNSLLKYNRARLHVLDRIAALQLQPGDLLPTQQELLADGGFSLICLKRALAELESEGVVSKGQGRRACLLKKLERNDFSGFVVFLCLYRYTPAIPSDVYSMRDEFARRGIELRIEAVKRPDVDLSGICRDALGIMVMGWITREWLDYLRIYKLPLLAVGSNPFPEELAGVGLDWYAAATEVCRMLRECQCRRIALVNGAKRYLPAREIERAVKDDARRAGLRSPSGLQVWCDFQDGLVTYRSIRKLFSRANEFDGVVLEEGTWPAALLMAREMNLPSRIRFGTILSITSVEGACLTNITVVSFPQTLPKMAVNFFLNRLKNGRTDEVEQFLLKPVPAKY